MTARQPLYQRIEQRLRDAISEGRHPVGALLPTEAELCAQLRVSRHTVREALRRLVDAGMVERRQGAGSVVVAREPPRHEAQSIRDIAALMQYASDTRLEVRSCRVAPLNAEDAALAHGEPGAAWLKVEALRLGAAGKPIAVTEILVHPRFAAIADALPQHEAFYAVVERRFGVQVAEVAQEIAAGMLPAEVARALKRRPREVGMLFLRRYLDAEGGTMIASRSWHPAERFSYAMRLKRGEE
ncbi:GntR family transcriptional regulator [Falsiroseomonas sp. CW058]|uniref:GntR family transcriptional regulator n=1 Tax=Falsiroseomonas sp. CW058 TaxID=3388664 RepID=UPI003D318B58